MKSKLTAALALCIGSLLAKGADQPPTTVEAHLKLISLADPLLGYGYMQGKKATGIVIVTDMFTEEFIYRGSSHFELIPVNGAAKVTKGDAPPNSVEKAKRAAEARATAREFESAGKPPLAWLDLPVKQGPLHLLLMVNPGKENGILAIQDPPGAFPAGTNRYFNLCPFRLAIRTPSGTQFVEPNNSKVIRPGSKPFEYYSLEILNATAPDEQPAFSGRVFHTENIRKLYLISPGLAGTGGVTLKVVEDRMLAPNKPAVQLVENGPGKK